MLVNGCDCSIVIKTEHREMDVPYFDETLREAVSLLEEEAAIEGDGICRAMRKKCGATGCIVTPLNIGTAPLLLYIAMGSMGQPVYISESRNLYRISLNLLPMEDTDFFDLIQDRGNERKLYESCRVKGFELRMIREEAIKLKLDIASERSPATYPYSDRAQYQTSKMSDTVIGSERFSGDAVSYEINGQEYKNIYGVTISSKKEGGTKTEIWIKRALNQGPDIPDNIEELTIIAHLLREKYEYRNFGMFRITIKRLVLNSDETQINSADTVIGPLRYYVAGTMRAEVFSTTDILVGC